MKGTEECAKFLGLYWAETSLELTLAALGTFKRECEVVSLLDFSFLFFSCLTQIWGTHLWPSSVVCHFARESRQPNRMRSVRLYVLGGKTAHRHSPGFSAAQRKHTDGHESALAPIDGRSEVTGKLRCAREGRERPAQWEKASSCQCSLRKGPCGGAECGLGVKGGSLCCK